MRKETYMLSREDARYVLCLILQKAQGKSLDYFSNPENLKKTLDNLPGNDAWMDISLKIFKSKEPRKIREGSKLEKEKPHRSFKGKTITTIAAHQTVLYDFARKVERGEPVCLTPDPYDAILKYVGQNTSINPIICSEQREYNRLHALLSLEGTLWSSWSLSDEYDDLWGVFDKALLNGVLAFGRFGKVLFFESTLKGEVKHLYKGNFKLEVSPIKGYEVNINLLPVDDLTLPTSTGLGSRENPKIFIYKKPNKIRFEFQIQNNVGAGAILLYGKEGIVDETHLYRIDDPLDGSLTFGTPITIVDNKILIDGDKEFAITPNLLDKKIQKEELEWKLLEWRIASTPLDNRRSILLPQKR